MDKIKPYASLVFALLQLFTSPRLGVSSDFDCLRDCFNPYQTFFPVSSCDTVIDVLNCYNDNRLICDQVDGILFSLGRANSDYMSLSCNPNSSSEDAEPPPPPTSPSPDSSCPSVPGVYRTNPSISMSPAHILPNYRHPSCSLSPVASLRQCSLFMDSHLRAFTSYRGGLEACSLPGSWFLLHHEDISIEVEGTNLEPNSTHTRLTKVNVTFHSHECNTMARSYVAYNSRPLPSEFAPPQSADEVPSSPLELRLGADGSVVTLMATWLNATIVIRRYTSFLSITIQVPRELSLESEGLCAGCPSHMYVNVTAFNNILLPSLCPDDNERALDNCFDFAGVVNQDKLLNVQNNSYFEACVFSMHKIKTPEVLSMFNAIASDAKLLANVGAEPRPPRPPLVLPPLNTPEVTPAITHFTTIPTTTSTMDTVLVVSSTTSFHSSTCTLTLITITTMLFFCLF